MHLLSSAGLNKMLTLPRTFSKELMAHASRLVDDEEVVLKSHYEVLIYLLSFFSDYVLDTSEI